LLAVTVTQVLSKFGQNGAAALAAKRLAIDKGLKALGVDKTRFSLFVADVSLFEGAAAAAILELVESCADDAAKVEAVAAVKQVFQAQDVSLDRIQLDCEDERGLDEVLEACREVARQVQQAYGERNSWRRRKMTLRTIAKDLEEDLGVKKPLLPAGVERLPAWAAHAISHLVESCESDAQKFEQVAAVERVYKAQRESIYEILFDGDDKPRGVAEVLEACRGVLQQVEQAKRERGGGGGGDGGRTAQAAKRLAIDEGLKKLGLDETSFSHFVANVSPYEGPAADAILVLVASCDTDEQRTAAVEAVKQVFQAQDVSLDRILLDGEDERGLDEVLEECREVVRQVQQAKSERPGRPRFISTRGGEAHVAALIEYARADVEALANLSSDDVLELLVKKSEELRPGAGPSWTPIADALNELGVPRTGGKEWERRYVQSHYLSLQSNKTPLTEDERRMVHALEWELGHDWAEIARRLGNGRDSNKIKCYWHDHGRHRQGVECGLCKKWRLLPKSAAKVDEDAPWACKDGGRSCDERCDYVLPETVEEAPVEAPADAAAVVSTPMALGDDDALQQPPPPDVVEQTAPPPRGSEDEDTSMTEAPAADAAPESLAAVDGGGSAHLVQQPAARAAPPSADPIVELDLSFAELKLKLTVDDASDFEDAVAALFAKVRAARAAATFSMNI